MSQFLLSPFKLAAAELRRFRGHPIRTLALVAIVLIPLVYGGLYLWFAWNPYGKLDQMPVAVVNEDQGAQVDVDGETQQINGGDQLVDQLKEDRIFDWRFTDAADAARGLRDGDYYMVITVPEDFSARLASLSGTDPEQATVEFDLNDANGYVAGIMASTVEAELRNQINTAVYVTFATTIFGDLTRLHDGLTDASAGASDLADGLATAQSGASDIESGLADLTTGAQRVADGADQVSDGVDQAVAVAQPVVQALADNWTQIQAGASSAADLADRANTDLDTVYATLCTDSPDADPDACAALEDFIAEADSANADIQNADDQIQSTSTDTLDQASDDLTALQTGASDVADGASQVAAGAATAEDGASDLADGLTTLHDGADTLATSLATAADSVPSTNPADDADNAEAYGSPVAVTEHNLNPADTYGRGLAPFFIAIALWVFGLMAYLVLSTVNQRALAGPLRSLPIAVGGWLPGALLGVLSAVVLYLAVELGLGLDPKDALDTVGLSILVILAFSAMAHLFKLAFGTAGSLVLVVLLMLQLTSAGGLYPVETTPRFFQALHPLLPMSYVVDALRVTISGGETSHVVRAVIVLAAYLVGALALSTLIVATRRKWKPDSVNEPLQV
ncbi:YhgE/Pip domain-containing protein [Glycomyces terrestris]|uniref:YhgE/Pip domain-containing protein n=1 Tax=Glycomyces terrestris TaxID=2493553 RepID=A0A426USA1_9ACTN|nr:YhgE/Pip domain-containing protein [Glycomyces terrestris]RRR96143.1 YhgE/Pip domain-containing protein [Glycomyces terrestris]